MNFLIDIESTHMALVSMDSQQKFIVGTRIHSEIQEEIKEAYHQHHFYR